MGPAWPERRHKAPVPNPKSEPLTCSACAGVRFYQRATVADPDAPGAHFMFDLADAAHAACFNMGVGPDAGTLISWSPLHALYTMPDGTAWAEHSNLWDAEDLVRGMAPATPRADLSKQRWFEGVRLGSVGALISRPPLHALHTRPAAPYGPSTSCCTCGEPGTQLGSCWVFWVVLWAGLSTLYPGGRSAAHGIGKCATAAACEAYRPGIRA